MPPLHLLVLDHDPARRERLIGRFRAAGDHATWAPDGAAAADAIATPGFDTLVLDLGWPALDLDRLRDALAPGRPVDPMTLEQAERRHIAVVLAHTGGNRRRAAQLLGIARSTLLHKVRKYGLEAGQEGR